MKLSYVIISYNRRERLLQTLSLLPDVTPLPQDTWDVWVVDNASADGSADAVAAQFPHVHLIRNPNNEGMAARNHAFAQVSGQYIITLDDDSYPIGNAVSDALDYLDAHPQTGVLVANVMLPDGRHEAPAMPAVMLGGASVIRKSVIDEVGGFPKEFFRQAEEYDLSMRVWNAGWAIERFEDIVFRHDKHPGGRPGALTARMDLRNNLIIAERYLPRAIRRVYRRDWAQRYGAIARSNSHRRAAQRARAEAVGWALRESFAGRQTISPATVEVVFELERQAMRIEAWAKQHGVQRVVIADYAKNLYATWRGCREAGLTVQAIADDGPAYRGLNYRGTPILPLAEAVNLRPDGIVIANINPAQIDDRAAKVSDHFPGPVERLWTPRFLHEPQAQAQPVEPIRGVA